MLLPSLLTAARLAAVPLFLADGRWEEWRFPVFAAACVTDLLDGFAARRLGSETRLGSTLDALVDFLLVAAVSYSLVLDGLLSPLFVALIVFAFAQFAVGGSRPGSDQLGKHIGTILFLALGVTLAEPATWVAQWSSLMAAGYMLVSVTVRWLPRSSSS